MLVREFTTTTWCCFSTWRLPLPPCREHGITLYCPSFMHFAHPSVHLPKHMHLCSNSSKQWHMLLMCKKKPLHLEKIEMHGIPQCVWCGWFCPETIRSHCWPFWLFHSTPKSDGSTASWSFSGAKSLPHSSHIQNSNFAKISLVIFCKYHKVTLLFANLLGVIFSG